MRDIDPVLVTGATGFVGRSLRETLSDTGRGVRRAVRCARDSSGVGETVEVGDIGPDTVWSPALDGVGSVVHLAARVHVMREAARDPMAEFRRVNVAGTEHLAREAAAAGVRRLVYVSSVKVNGESTPERPFTEKDVPDPQDPYAVSKFEAEQALRRVSGETGIEVVVLRPPLVYGPGVRANFLSLLRLVDRGLPLPFGAVDNRRSLIYVRNLAGAMVAALEHPEAAGETFLVGDGEDVSTAGLVRRLASALGRPSRLLPVPPALMLAAGKVTGRSDAVERLVSSLAVDSGRIRHRLDWEPPYTLDGGLAETAAWFKRDRRK